MLAVEDGNTGSGEFVCNKRKDAQEQEEIKEEPLDQNSWHDPLRRTSPVGSRVDATILVDPSLGLSDGTAIGFFTVLESLICVTPHCIKQFLVSN